MQNLPNGYIPKEQSVSDGSHIVDTGIAPSENIEIEIMFSVPVSSGTTRNYIFGARDTNSNTAAKQFTLCKTYTNGFYLGYFGTNTLISSTVGTPQIIDTFDILREGVSLFKGDAKECSIAESIAYSVYDSSSVSASAGANSIYLFGMNNAGNAVYSPYDTAIYYCKIWDDGVLVRDYVPCVEESTGHAGLYDLVNETFNLVDSSNFNNSYFVIAPTTDGNGEIEGSIGRYFIGVITAIANSGYVFKHWEFNGSIISTDPNLLFYYQYLSGLGLSTRDTFNPVAVFAKKTDENAFLGFKMAVFSGQPTKYYQDGHYYNRYLLKDVYNIRRGSVQVDGTQQANSSFTITGNFSITQSDFVYIYSQLGKKMYVGIVDSIEENEIICSDINSIFNKECLFHDNSSKTITYGTSNGTANIKITNSIISFALQQVYLKCIRTVSDSSYSGNTLSEPFGRFSPIKLNLYPVYFSHIAGNIFGESDKTSFPLWSDLSVDNLYEKIQDIFNDFNIYVDCFAGIKKEIRNGETITYLDLELFPRAALTDELVIGDNSEQISNIFVTEESGSATYLAIFNSAGTTLRGAYYINSSGEIIKETSFVNLDIYSIKVVNSDDNLNTLVQQNLTSGKFNHKITFDVDTNGQLNFDSFAINKKVHFYYGGKLYDSIITAIKYDLNENDGKISSVNITLGMVRTNLTSKLNLGKAGKKKK